MELIKLEEAIKILIKNTKKIEEMEEIDILDALGYSLKEDILAPISNPPFDRSPLDGFTLHHSSTISASISTPKSLLVDNEIMAGDHLEKPLKKNTAIQIMTGAPIPLGCNCVIKQEDVNYDEKTKKLDIFNEIKEYQNYCFKGEDYKKNDLMMSKGEKITSNHIGLLASLGRDKVKVFRKPIVGIISTGNELISPGNPLTLGKIYNSNLYLIATRLKELGADVLLFPPISDEVDIISKFLSENMVKTDIFITTGGVSVGKLDIMHDVVKKLKAKKLFWGVDIQPGTPVLASLYKKQIILSLSGNPFAALVNFELLGRRILNEMSNGSISDTKIITSVIAEGNFNKKSKRKRFVRAEYKDEKIYIESEKNSSGHLSSLLYKNALVEIEAGNGGIKIGDKVEVLLID